MVAGYPSRFPQGSTNWNAFWSTLERHSIPGSNGRYKQTFEDPIVNGVPEVRYVFKVEADGYKSAITRVVEGDERDVEFNFALQNELILGARPGAAADTR